MSAISHEGSEAAGEAFGQRIHEALEADGGARLAGVFTAPLVTALVVSSADTLFVDWTSRALLALRDALERAGVPRGRQFVLVGRPAPELVQREPGSGERSVAALRERLSLPAILHDPARAGFTAGRLRGGEPVELDDELREAEAIVCVGTCGIEGGGLKGGPHLLVPGVASLATRRAWTSRVAEAGARAAVAFALEAETLAPVDLALTWNPAGSRVQVGRGREEFAALARAHGFA